MGYGRVNAFHAVSPPATPQNLTASASGTYQPVTLNWTANTEPDIKSAGKYRIFRAFNYSSIPPTAGYSLLATINAYNGATAITSWTDSESAAYPSSFHLHYKIKARDSGGLESGYSNIATYQAFLKSTGEEGEIITKYSLDQNYPNPFNPSTTITFSLPEKMPVHLQVFDLNGKLVTELVNEELATGRYEISFNASKFGSGVYIYRLNAGSFSQVRKMMLIK